MRPPKTSDGNNHTISNCTYITTDEDLIGLFGYAEGNDVAIKNLGLINPKVTVAEGYQSTGALVGLFKYGTIENCFGQSQTSSE